MDKEPRHGHAAIAHFLLEIVSNVSAAATTARIAKKKAPKRKTAREDRMDWPDWACEHRAWPTENFDILPRAYGLMVLSGRLTYLACRILVLYGTETYAAYGKRWEWMDKTAAEIASELGASEDGVNGALMEIRREQCGELRDFGKRKLFRAIEENFPSAPAPKKPASSDEYLRTAVRDEDSEDDENKESQEIPFAEPSPFQPHTFQIRRGQHVHRKKVGFFVERFEHESDSDTAGFAELTLTEGTLRLVSRMGTRSAEAGGQESRGRAERNGVVSDKFEVFMDAAAKAELPASRVDWDKARKLWAKLEVEQKIAAIRGIEDRVKCGQYADPSFRPRPDKYLADFAWERPLRPAKEVAKGARSGAKSSDVAEFTEWTNTVDRRMGNRR